MKNLIIHPVIFESTITDGPMSGQKKFYDEEMTIDEIRNDLLKRRINLGKKHNFNGKKIIIPKQKNKNCNSQYIDGKYELITNKLVEEKDDLWNLTIPCDILVMNKHTKGIVIAYPVADCPVLIAEDTKNQISALTHCSAEHINRELPIDLIKSLEDIANTKKNDIRLYISSCANGQNYTYDKYPLWATNKQVWENHIFKKNGYYHINLKESIIEMLSKYNIKLWQITASPKDTITNPTLYSNNAAHHNIPYKNGRFLVGCFYPEDKEKTTLIKTKKKS